MKLSRRSFLQASALGGAMSLAPKLVFSAVAASPKDVIVVIFQRGAMDGLQAVVPYGDADYYKLRPTIGIPDTGTGAVLPLDGFFGLNPALAPILPLYNSGQLAAVHATGIKSGSRSHFQCQDTIERAYLSVGGSPSGWLNRHTDSVGLGSTFQAVGIASGLQMSLRGPAPSIGMQSIASFTVSTNSKRKTQLEDTLYDLYSAGSKLGVNARRALDATDYLALANPTQYLTANGAVYPTTTFGSQMFQVAQLIKAGVGLQMACVDIGGWDHHDDINTDLPPLLDELSKSLLAFHTDLGTAMSGVTVLVMTEFGRRAGENGSLGTDHGTGSSMLLMGGGVVGGHVYTDWPGLAPAKLYQGDLDVTTDIRTVMSELLVKRGQESNLAAVFPGFVPGPYLGCFAS
jgi:uncharacterized protein (DUF1501 family)